MQKRFIVYIIAIIVVLTVVFLSQQAYIGGVGKTFIFAAANQASAYAAKGSSWAISIIYPKISNQVQSGGAAITTAANQANKKVSENIGQKISNYFSGIGNSILHPGTPQNCLPAQTGQTSPVKTAPGQ